MTSTTSDGGQGTGIECSYSLCRDSATHVPTLGGTAVHLPVCKKHRADLEEFLISTDRGQAIVRERGIDPEHDVDWWELPANLLG